MTKRTSVLHIQPFSQAHTMKKVFAPSDLSLKHVLITNSTDVIMLSQSFLTGKRQRIDFSGCRTSFDESFPTHFGFAPDIEIGVNDHHGSSDGSTTFKEQDPTTVKKQEDGKAEFHGIACKIFNKHL